MISSAKMNQSAQVQSPETPSELKSEYFSRIYTHLVDAQNREGLELLTKIARRLNKGDLEDAIDHSQQLYIRLGGGPFLPGSIGEAGYQLYNGLNAYHESTKG